MRATALQTDGPLPLEAETSPPTPEPPAAEPTAEPTNLSLEDRVRRLEDVLATLQLASPDWIEATRSGRPPRESITNTLLNTDHPLAGMAPDVPLAPVASLPRQPPWLLADIYIELRCVPRLFFDPRYRLSWQTLLLTPLLILGLILSRWVIGSIPLVGWIIDTVLFVVLLYILVKVLSREATLYRQSSPDLPVAWRL